MTASPAPPCLLHFRVSHYNEKVRWALDLKRWPHTREALLPGFHVLRARRLTGQSMLPVLVLDGRALADSSRIIAELERLQPDPPLYPADPRDRMRALAIASYFDEDVAPTLRRLFWSTYLPHPAECARMATDGFPTAMRAVWRVLFPLMRPLMRRNMGIDAAGLAHARTALTGYFDRLERDIGASGYLVGERFGIADLTAAAVMTAIIRPPEFPYPLPEPWPPELIALRDRVRGHAAFRWVLDMYSRHRGVSAEIARTPRPLRRSA
jgi:glutathione S-transferase